MANRNRDRIAELVDQFEPKLRDAFLAAINDIRDNADLERIADALVVGDINRAIAAMHLDPASFAQLDNALTDAFKAGGNVTMQGLPAVTLNSGARVVFRFNARNPAAEEWLATYSAELVTEIIDDQRDAIRAALEDGMSRGVNPRQLALDIIGRYNRDTGQREGGIIGLTAQQAQYVENALTELLSGDPDKLRNYLERAARDQRFDRTVLAAIRDGKPVSAEDAARITQRYRDRLLKVRGDTIARTEALTALHAGQHEALEQVAAKAGLPKSAVQRVWRTNMDGRERETHAAMNGQKRAIDKPFVSPSGARLRYPGDPNGPAGEIINCRCWAEPAVDFLHGIE